MLSLIMTETMSGWIEQIADRHHEPFEFSIRIFFEDRLHPLRRQPFKGTVRFAQRNLEVPVSGSLTLQPTGPKYELDFDFPGIGPVHLAGEKTYSLFNLRESLVTCPLTLFHRGEEIGYAEVAYQDSLIGFPFKALRLGTA
jgi:hypothetical protein